MSTDKLLQQVKLQNEYIKRHKDKNIIPTIMTVEQKF